MSDIQVIENQSFWSEIVPELRVDDGGVGYASITAAARLCGVKKQTLSRHLKCVSEKPSGLAQTLTAEGFDAVSLARFANEGIPDEALHVISTYYAMDAGPNCTDEAKFVVKQFGKYGWRKGIQSLTGYQPETKALPAPEEVKPLPNNEALGLRGMIDLLRDEVRVLTGQHQDMNGFIEFLCGKYRGIEQEIAELKTAGPEAVDVLSNNPAQLRTEIKEMVNAVAFEQDADHRVLWGKLYQAFQRTYGVCPEPDSGESRLDAFMRHDLVGPLHRVARLLFGYRAS